MNNPPLRTLPTTGKQYFYGHAHGNPSHKYLLPVLEDVIASLNKDADRAIDVGCGNGFVSDFMAETGFRVVGVDPSNSGIQIARRHFPSIEFYQASAYEDLHGMFGTFDLTVSLEVIEHLYSPRTLATTLFDLTKPGGVCVVSTPYHGYIKNVTLALLGRLDKHFNPLREGGHIKFFSVRQLVMLLQNVGFRVRRIYRVGRLPPWAKSIIVVAERKR